MLIVYGEFLYSEDERDDVPSLLRNYFRFYLNVRRIGSRTVVHTEHFNFLRKPSRRSCTVNRRFRQMHVGK